MKIHQFHADSDGVKGAPRITADLREDGEVVSRKTVAKLMRQGQILGITPRPWRPVTTLADQVPHIIPDWVGRAFDRGVLNVVGRATSPTWQPGRAGCTCAPSEMGTPGE